MSKAKDLLKNTAIVTIGKISTQLITFFLLPIYTAVLTNEEYGTVDLLNTLVGLFLPIVTLQIEQGVFRFLIDCRDNLRKQKKVISTTFGFVFIQALIYFLVFLVASNFINNPYKYFLATNLIIAIFSSIFLQICRGLGDNTRYAIGSLLSGVSTVLLNILFIVVFKFGAYGMLVATFLGNFICVMYILIKKKIYRYIKIKYFDKRILGEIIKYSIPLVPNIISWWIINASDRTIITRFIGIGQNGIYAAANKFSGAFTSLYSVFNLTWTESAAVNINSPDRDEFFSKILDITIRFFGSLVLGIISFMPFVFSILINEKFIESYNQIPILMLAGMFNILVSFVGSIYVAKKITKEIAKTSIFAAIINIVINIIFIKKIGLYAASISTLIAYMAMCIYRFIDSKKYVNFKFNKKVVYTMIFLLVFSTIIYYGGGTKLKALNATVITIYAIIINKNSAGFIIQGIRKKFNK